jgi:hypothetical protein
MVTTYFAHCRSCHCWQQLTAIYLSSHVKHISRVMIHEQHNYHLWLCENNTVSYLDWGHMPKCKLSALNMHKIINTSDLPAVRTLSNYALSHSDNFTYLCLKLKKLAFYLHNVQRVLFMILAIGWDYFPKQHQPVCHCDGNRFYCVWDRTEILCLKYFMFKQLNGGDVCVVQALNNTRAQVWCTKLCSWFVTARWLPSYLERLTPLYQLLWILKMYKETTHPGKPSDKFSVTFTLFETVQSSDLGTRSSGTAPHC